jgi:HD-GYP domain-containing protein (c-di-GMP phosphodiesterase class II)
MFTKYIVIDNDSQTSIEVDRMVIGKRLPFDVFVKDEGVIKHLFHKGILFTKIAKDILEEKGITEVCIKDKDVHLLGSYFSSDDSEKSSCYDDLLAFKTYSFHKEQIYQIDRNLLSPGTRINFSLFVLTRFTLDTLLEASEKSPGEICKRILDAKGDIVIKNHDIPIYHNYIDSLLMSNNVSKQESLQIKAIAIRENSKIITRDLLNNPRSGEKIKESIKLVNSTIDYILDNKDAIYNLLSLRNCDYYTYTHSVNVSILSIGLGVKIALNRDDIERLAIGSMFHDIGKSAISHEILNKQGKLDDAEYATMETHVTEGEKILRTHRDIPEESFISVLQHHETLSGTGYPCKLLGPEIKLFGRITAIADCYDALTTERPYRSALTPFYALSLIINKKQGDYDPEVLKEFVRMLGKIQ